MLPPSPRKIPIIGNLHQLGRYPQLSLQSLSNRYVHLILLHFGKVPVVVSLLLRRDHERSGHDILKQAESQHIRRVGLRRLLAADAKHMRASLTQQKKGPILPQRERRRDVDRLGRSSTVVNLGDELMTMTNDVICRVALGRKYGGEEKRFKKFLKEFVELLGASSVGEFIPGLGWVDSVVGLDARVERVHKLFDEFWKMWFKNIETETK